MIFASCLLAAVAVATPMGAHEFEFMKFIAEWNKSYETREEYQHRFSLWSEIDAHVREVNAPGSAHTHEAGHNVFSDWSEEEYGRMLAAKTARVAEVEEPAVQTNFGKRGHHDWR